jgi:hypothetical protein
MIGAAQSGLLSGRKKSFATRLIGFPQINDPLTKNDAVTAE